MQRQVTVYEASENGKVTVLENVEATTLGELKRLMVAKGINIENMDFMEGVSNVVLRDDSSALPKDIPYKGTTTNDLFIYLSLKNKKIASGLGMTRREAYDYIKENGLNQEVVSFFGRNYTQVSTQDLVEFIEAHENNEEDNTPAVDYTAENVSTERLYKAFKALVNILFESSCLYTEDKEDILNALEGKEPAPAKSNFQNDMDDILSRIKQ